MNLSFINYKFSFHKNITKCILLIIQAYLFYLCLHFRFHISFILFRIYIFLLVSFSSQLSSFSLSPTLLSPFFPYFLSFCSSPILHLFTLSLPIFHSLKFIIFYNLNQSKISPIPFAIHPIPIYSPPIFSTSTPYLSLLFLHHLSSLHHCPPPFPFVTSTHVASFSFDHPSHPLQPSTAAWPTPSLLHADSSPMVVLSARRSAQVAACRQASLVSMTEGEIYRVARVPWLLFNLLTM